ncbi:Fe2+-enterobactin ABC transporter substrate-binding protein [Sedimentitalea sp. XS_ASV28]|uniref:Fe2+-enterobactin ABC transporter substrate-binding protein n=1 Tax=Sedimentitalea sp. XS_ASV28 TaxID=3241296 RepID=UPI0035113119
MKSQFPISASLGLLAFFAAPAQSQEWPRNVIHEAGILTLDAQPRTVVSTTPSVTGILLAIGAPLVASAATTPGPLTDDKGFFSQWADLADERGVEVLYPNLTFDMESIIGWWPDLVVASTTGADSILPQYPLLQSQGIPTIAVNYSDRSWQDLARELGQALGVERGAADAIARFDQNIAEIASTITPHDGTVTIVGYQLAGTYSVGKASSPQATLLTALGFEVAGLPDRLRSQVTRSSNFDFFSRENLTDAIVGDTVFLLNGTEKTVDTFLNDPVLANLPAVRNRQVYALGQTSFRIDYFSGLQMAETVATQFAAQ